MGEISESDTMRIQTSRELGSGYRRIVSKFPDKQWNLQSVKNYADVLISEVQPLSENLTAEDRDQQGRQTSG